MTIEDQITRAIGVHGQWKFRLTQAVDTGASEFDPDVVKFDNRCEFGKWLHEEITPEEQVAGHYSHVVELHAKFHTLASNILREAVAGDKDHARELIASGSEYAALSSEMTLSLMAWKKSLAAAA
ncbi:MAG: CZB domain-containing protein [Acidimicrobiales bacterium]